jgi:hypothetical protein
MTTRKTLERIDEEQIMDPKKFEKLPFHKGQVNFPAKMTIGEPEEAIENEKRRNINNAAKWGKEDVNKAIKQIEKELDIPRVKMISNLSEFFGLPTQKVKEKHEEVLDKWRKRKDFNYIKKEEEVNKKKGGKRKTRRKKRRKTRKTRGKKGANYRGRVIFLDFNIEKMKESGIIPEIYGYADNLNVLHKYRVIEDNGIVLKLMHINDKEYKGLKLPISFVKNGTVTIQIITKKMGGRRSRKNKRSKKRRVRKRKTRKRRRKRR